MRRVARAAAETKTGRSAFRWSSQLRARHPTVVSGPVRSLSYKATSESWIVLSSMARIEAHVDVHEGRLHCHVGARGAGRALRRDVVVAPAEIDDGVVGEVDALEEAREPRPRREERRY